MPAVSYPPPCRASFEDFLRENRGLVGLVVARLAPLARRLGVDPDDVESVALAGAWKGFRTYDPRRGMKLSSWVVRTAWQEAADFVRQWDVWQPLPAPPDGEGGGEVEDIKSSREEQLVDVREQLRHLLGTLNPAERELLVWKFGLDGHADGTLTRIARRLGVSRTRVGQRIGRILQKLRAKAG